MTVTARPYIPEHIDKYVAKLENKLGVRLEKKQTINGLIILAHLPDKK